MFFVLVFDHLLSDWKFFLEVSLSKNPILVTALYPIIGYEKAALIAKKAYKENRPIIDVAAEETEISKLKLSKLLDPSKLAKGGV